jgi:hypothetical protein
MDPKTAITLVVIGVAGPGSCITPEQATVNLIPGFETPAACFAKAHGLSGSELVRAFCVDVHGREIIE